MTLRFHMVPFTPGAGYEVRHRGPFTVLRLGAGGFAPYEPVRLSRGRDPNGTPLRLLHVDAGYLAR